jgi:hypothetical protein
MKQVLHNAAHKITTAVFQMYLQLVYKSPFMVSLKLGFLWINRTENGFAQQRLVKVTQPFSNGPLTWFFK